MIVGFEAYAEIKRYYDKTARHGIWFQLCNELRFWTKDGQFFKVEPGFITDLGSIPRPFWPILSPHEFPSAYILHDSIWGFPGISRFKTNDILYEALLLSHAPKWKAKIIYYGVQLSATYLSFRENVL